MPRLTVQVIQTWRPDIIRMMANRIGVLAENVDHLRTQFTGQTSLHDAWVSPAASLAKTTAQNVANSVGGVAESTSHLARIVDAFAASVEFAQAEIRGASDLITGVGLNLRIGPDGRYPPLLWETATAPASSDPERLHDYGLRSINPFDSTATAVIFQQRMSAPGMPEDMVTAFEHYRQRVDLANQKLDGAVAFMERADGEATGAMESAGVGLRASASHPTNLEGAVAVKGDPTWNMAVDAITRIYHIDPSQITDAQVAGYIAAVAAADPGANGQPFAGAEAWNRVPLGDHAGETAPRFLADGNGAHFQDAVANGIIAHIGSLSSLANGAFDSAIHPLDTAGDMLESSASQVAHDLHDGEDTVTDPIGAAQRDWDETQREWQNLQDEWHNLDVIDTSGNFVGGAIVGAATGGYTAATVKSAVVGTVAVPKVGTFLISHEARVHHDLPATPPPLGPATAPSIPQPDAGALSGGN